MRQTPSQVLDVYIVEQEQRRMTEVAWRLTKHT